MAGNPTPPASRTISWNQQVIESDPAWAQKYQRPVVYEFSNGRNFVWNPNVYTQKTP